MNHDATTRGCADAGYDVPEIVYWNITSIETVPVEAERKGVAVRHS